jgi:hypothetical protein
MPSSGMLRHVNVVRTQVSVEHIASNIRVTILGELGATLEVISNRRTLRRNTSVLLVLLNLILLRSVHRLLVTSLFLVHRFLSP